jgi:hypothetical protein
LDKIQAKVTEAKNQERAVVVRRQQQQQQQQRDTIPINKNLDDGDEQEKNFEKLESDSDIK